MFAFNPVSKLLLLLPHLGNDTPVNLPPGAEGPLRAGWAPTPGDTPARLPGEYRSGRLGGAFVDHSPERGLGSRAQVEALSAGESGLG